MKEEIQELINLGKYDDIFHKFGQKIFLKYVPKKYKKMDIEKLLEEGRYEDIYLKYGEKAYNKILFKVMYKEIRENKGQREANIWKYKVRIQRFLKALGFTTVLGLSVATGGKNNENFQNVTTEISSSIDELSIKVQNDWKELIDDDNRFISKDNIFIQGIYIPLELVSYFYLFCIFYNLSNQLELAMCKQKVEEYLQQVKKYGKSVKRMNLSNIQIFMKVMEDMWKNIQGFKPPKLFSGKNAMMDLVLATKDGYGVCKNMALYVARRLNEINPDFNARVAEVYVPINYKGYKKANIKTKVIKDPLKNMNELKLKVYDRVTKNSGNHVIVLLDSKEDNAIIALDPTSPGIGVLIEGRIYMFNESEYGKSSYVLKEFTTTAWANLNKTNLGFSKMNLDGIKDYNNSWKPWSRNNYDRLRNKYSLLKQNEALKELRRMQQIVANGTREKPDDKKTIQISEKDKS